MSAQRVRNRCVYTLLKLYTHSAICYLISRPLYHMAHSPMDTSLITYSVDHFTPWCTDSCISCHTCVSTCFQPDVKPWQSSMIPQRRRRLLRVHRGGGRDETAPPPTLHPRTHLIRMIACGSDSSHCIIPLMHWSCYYCCVCVCVLAFGFINGCGGPQ